MTVEQLDLTGGVHIVGLTDRQQAALEFVEKMGGVSLDELGALMCERRGKHQQDSRCQWCLDNGATVANELHAKRLLERRAGGWYSTRPLGSEPATSAAAAAGSEPSGPFVPPRLRDTSARPRPEAVAEPDASVRARSTDPETSRAAAASVGDLTGKQRAVLGVFARHGGMHDEDLLLAYDVTPDVPRQTDSGLRTRRHELVDAGLLEDSGRKAKTEAGRASIVWQITPAGRRALGRVAGPTNVIPF